MGIKKYIVESCGSRWCGYKSDDDGFLYHEDDINPLLEELEVIKKQEPFGYFLPDNGGNVFTQSKDNVRIAKRFNWPVIHLYAKPIYQHSFTVYGHTFYADNEVDILYLERKFGVGGKAKLNLVEDK